VFFQESLERRQQRAKRFGVSASETEEKSAGDLDLDSLYKRWCTWYLL